MKYRTFQEQLKDVGIVYNSIMQFSFGDYRFSHSIQDAYGYEPDWLRWIHDTFG